MSKAMTAASKEQLIELMQYLSQNISVPTIGIGGGFAPIGTIISYMGTTAPQDYLICDGTTHNIADYKQLSDFFAAQFGSANFFGGDGVTTFKVPDLRGEFLRGSGTNGHSGQGIGANVGVHQDGTGHVNFISDSVNSYIQSENNFSIGPINYDTRNKKATTRYSREFTIKNTSSQEVDAYPYYTSRPTNTSVLYCIKAVAAGDVYSTEERVVGTWIDGKKVYEKTIVDTMPSEVGVDKMIDANTTIETVVSSYAVIHGGSYQPLQLFIYGDTEASRYFIRTNSASSNQNKIGVRAGHTRFVDATVHITIRYTKTTD